MTVINRVVLAAWLEVIVASGARAETILPNEPAPGQLGVGQTVYVACGLGKAKKITGGSNKRTKSGIRSGQPIDIQGRKREYGPCLPFKN